jgi:hypothetical protein
MVLSSVPCLVVFLRWAHTGLFIYSDAHSLWEMVLQTHGFLGEVVQRIPFIVFITCGKTHVIDSDGTDC